MAARKRTSVYKKVPGIKLTTAGQEHEENDLKKVKARIIKELEENQKNDKEWFDKELDKNLKNIK